jgi:hypothetical protein
MKKIIFAGLLFSTSAFADMPYIANNTAESRDRIQSGDMMCETSKAQTTVNAGVYGSDSSDYGFQTSDKGGYVGISIPIGDSGSKVDCNRLYDLVVKEKEMKIKELEKRLQLMEQRTLTVGK